MELRGHFGVEGLGSEVFGFRLGKILPAVTGDRHLIVELPSGRGIAFALIENCLALSKSLLGT